jgi:beta,beta-carotene 9',10'-dioxygenase
MLDKSPFSFGGGFRSLTREIADPLACPSPALCPPGSKARCCAPAPPNTRLTHAPIITGSTGWRCCTVSLRRWRRDLRRFLKSNAFCAAARTGKISYGEFATDPCRTLFGRIAAIFDPKLTDNCCVNVADYARQMVAFTETSIPSRFSPETLETLGVFGYGDALKGQISTAHPHYDAARRCHYNYIADLGMKSVYRLGAIGNDGTEKQVAEIPVAYMHSFGMSADHLVLTEFPLVVNPIDLRLVSKPFIHNYRWEPERGLVFHVVEKDSGRLVRTAKTDAAFAFHHVNAFADGDGLTVDVIVYPDATIIDQLYLARLRASTPGTATGTFTRFQVPFASEALVTRRTLAKPSLELPRINYERYAGKPYRYVWAPALRLKAIFSIRS